jgi:lipid II:glycine glycyltransferase (peptidoglycan interpeptide bridge formation enzyme)
MNVFLPFGSSAEEDVSRDTTNLRASIIDPLEDRRWPNFVRHHPAATAFHQPAWTSALAETFAYQPRFHVLERANNEIVAAWPAMLVKSQLTGNRLVCLPFCHRAGPLVDTEEQSEQLLAALVLDARSTGARSIEVRDWPSGIAILDQLHIVNLYSTHMLDLSAGPDAVMHGLTRNIRDCIQRARTNGVTVRIANDAQDMAIFYGMYVKQRRHQGLLPQPEAFLRAIFEKLITQGDGFMILAEHGGRHVCGLLNLGHGTTIFGTHSAAVPQARQLLATPLAMWKSVEVACARGYTRFDLGRCENTAAGLLNFKKQWGAAREDLPYYFYGRLSGVNTGKPHRLKKLVLDAYTRFAPEAIVAGLSRPMYRHLG